MSEALQGQEQHPSWVEWVREDPTRSSWYIDRMRGLAAAGDDLGGEARLVNALVAPGARLLDAGCGPGRVTAALAALGHTVVGVDVDPKLVDAAREDHPELTFVVGDLTALSLDVLGDDSVAAEPFDGAVCVGNVLPFLGPGRQRSGLESLARCVRDGGRLAVGFQTTRGYSADALLADADAAGWRLDVRLSTWDLLSPDHDLDFIVAVFTRAHSA